MIWDLHCHIGGFPGRTPDERMARLMEYADRMGIDRVVIFMGYPFLEDPSPEQLREQNDQVLQALSHWHHRAFGFVYLNPKHVEASLQELKRCVADGPMVGVKLWVAERARAASLDPIIERAIELEAPIFQHTWFKVGGNDPGESSPLDVIELARRHPEARLICGHTGGDWEVGIRAVRHTNLPIGIAGSDPTAGFVEMAVRELTAARIIYGSDVAGRSFASQLAKVRGADIPERAKKQILGGNLRRLLTPILTAKGIKV
jgi:predicted TIM-barrel fold metal-dependent hydrolase